jgi:GTP-binding protein HflX
VGFISRLPAYMVDAFRSTLQELSYSAVVLLVLDISEQVEEIARKLNSCIHVMYELGVPMTKVVYILNKVDLTSVKDAENKSTRLGLPQSKQRVLLVSAKTGYKIDTLKDVMTLLTVGDPMPLISEVSSSN